MEALINTAFDQRPKEPKCSKRPCCFGSPENRRAHYEQSHAIAVAHEVASEAYRAGQREVEFPSGTYPPPIIAAAA